MARLENWRLERYTADMERHDCRNHSHILFRAAEPKRDLTRRGAGLCSGRGFLPSQPHGRLGRVAAIMPAADNTFRILRSSAPVTLGTA